MNARTAVATMVFALSFATAAGFAAVMPPTAPVLTPVAAGQPKPGKVRQVSFALHNNTAAGMTLQAGAEQITLQPGETRRVRLPEGMVLTTVAATTRLSAGETLTTVSSVLRGATLGVS